MKGEKHLIECHCVLPQYRHKENPIYHKFVVFSVIDESDTCVPKYAQCNNCGVVHKVIDLCRSEIMSGRDELKSVISKDDIKIMLPEDITRVLEAYDCDLPVWEHAMFIIHNKQWGSSIVVSREELDNERHGKMITFAGPGKTKIEPFATATTIEGKRR
tara:strand:+ start:1318 stop:1794 length:477 start_codon:yes stop_codon:yes gene_type:complete